MAWSRIFPTGKGDINAAGLAFYDRLIDNILAADLLPNLTLYHWDLPQALEDAGGWLNRDTAQCFTDYADVVARHFGDRISLWATFNEPLCSAFHGYTWGVHAPGHIDPTFRSAAHAIHHIYLAHGQAVSVIRQHTPPDTQVGIVLNVSPAYPASDSEADRAATRRGDGVGNRWFLDPLFKGTYPADVLDLLGSDAQPPIQDGDMAIISTPLDFLGVNYYFRSVVQDDPTSDGIAKNRSIMPAGATRTDMGWEIYPDGLRDILIRVAKDYQPKALYVTENGSAMRDILEADGSVHDARRVAYLRDHLRAVQEAIEAGAPVKGYYAWSLLDNFEWAYGYEKRFGLIYVDYATQKRYLKDSFYYYQSVIQAKTDVVEKSTDRT